MYKSKLFYRLEKITRTEWKPLNNYLKGSVGEGNDPYKLFEYIYSYKDRLEHKNLTIEIVNCTVFPHLSKKSFQNVMSVLSKEIEEFWVWWDMRKDDLRMKLHTLESLNHRALYSEVDKIYQNIYSNTDNNMTPGLWNDYTRFRGAHEILFSSNPIKGDRDRYKLIMKYSIRSIISFASNISQYYKAELINLKRIYNDDWNKEIAQLDAFDNGAENTFLRKGLEFQSNLLSSNFTLNPSILEAQLKSQKIKLSPVLKSTYYFRVRRYLIYRARSGKKGDLKMLKEFIKWSIDSDTILYDGQITIGQYLTDLNNLCALKQIDLAVIYGEKYAEKIDNSVRKEAIDLRDIILNFSKGAYDNVLNVYSRATIKSPLRKLQAAGYFLRSAYMIYGSNEIFFDYHLRNVLDLLNRNKGHFSKSTWDSWKRFLKIFKTIVYKKGTGLHVTELESITNVMHRQWIISILKEESDKDSS